VKRPAPRPAPVAAVVHELPPPPPKKETFIMEILSGSAKAEKKFESGVEAK